MSEQMAAAAGGQDELEAEERAGVREGREVPEGLKEEIRLLDELLAEWRDRAMKGEGEAVDRVLAIQRQRATLLQTWPGAGGTGASGMRVSAGSGGRGDEKEVRVVIEYVDDWRQAGRRSTGGN